MNVRPTLRRNRAALAALALSLGALSLAGCQASSTTTVGIPFLVGSIHKHSTRWTPGASLESGRIWAFSGQNIHVYYRATIREGSVNISIKKVGNLIVGPEVWRTTLDGTGGGSAVIPIHETGRYKIFFWESVRDGDYDVSWYVW